MTNNAALAHMSHLKNTWGKTAPMKVKRVRALNARAVLSMALRMGLKAHLVSAPKSKDFFGDWGWGWAPDGDYNHPFDADRTFNKGMLFVAFPDANKHQVNAVFDAALGGKWHDNRRQNPHA